jgi:mannose-1-phosphate guanylyltransferase
VLSRSRSCQRRIFFKRRTLNVNSAISIDYAVMEQVENKVVPATFKWSDLGSLNRFDYLIANGHKDGSRIW